MHVSGESDSPIVPKKPANNDPGAPRSAEPVEGRGLTKGNGMRTLHLPDTGPGNEWHRLVDRTTQVVITQGKSRMR
jgi:hypothetical protein